MDKKKVYYKVLSHCMYGKRHSAFVSTARGGIYYPKRRWAKPSIKGSKLMVYKYKKHAKTMCPSGDTVVRCYIRGEQTENLFLTIDHDNIRKFWKMVRKTKVEKLKELYDDVESDIGKAAFGAIYADAVYCLE
jgi:hypothetical protein